MDAINVIPFIDIMLVLLAIVLATATFIAEGRLQLKLPEAETADAPLPEVALEIGIDGDGRLFADGAPSDLDTLATRLRGLPPETPIRLRVDEAARFGGFVAVIDLLRANGLHRLNISTLRP
jgi:biopolymer transport protein ExbD